MRASFVSALAGLLLIALGGPALSAETGTLAWTLKPLTVFEGPGTAYDVLGDVEGKIRLRVDRCTYQWCQVHTARVRGWVPRGELNFGQYPRAPWSGPVFNYKSGGPGEICLYEGRNYTGDALCATSGTVVRDLLLHRVDNRYSSITVEGNVSVTLCRDRDFSSYCERVIRSQPRLNGFLDNNVSSFRVY